MNLKDVKRPASKASNVSEAIKKIANRKSDTKEGVDLTKMAKNLFKRKTSQEDESNKDEE